MKFFFFHKLEKCHRFQISFQFEYVHHDPSWQRGWPADRSDPPFSPAPIYWRCWHCSTTSPATPRLHPLCWPPCTWKYRAGSMRQFCWDSFGRIEQPAEDFGSHCRKDRTGWPSVRSSPPASETVPACFPQTPRRIVLHQMQWIIVRYHLNTFHSV